MECSEAPRNPKESDAVQSHRPAASIAGQLSRTEAFLYNGARCIDRVFDQLQDRPLRSIAVSACVLALVSAIPH